MFTISFVGNTAGLTTAQLNAVRTVAQAAGDHWARYLDLGTASIDLEIDFESLGNTTLASAGPTLFFDRRENGLNIFEPGTIIEI